MAEMTTHERMTRMYEHREADRVPITDSPWNSTIERWQREGMPKDVTPTDYFGMDKFASIHADNSPRYPEKVVEETDEYVISVTRWGVTMKNWKHAASVPEFLDFTVTDPESWKEAKAKMQPAKDRINWDGLKRDYETWRREGRWIRAAFWFGFDVTHAHTVGTERILFAMAQQPDWVADMFNHYLDVDIALFQMVWDAGYVFDEVSWPDDMGYKGKQFFSPDMYRELLKPVQKRAAEWAHQKGVKVRLHSCGDIRPLVPELIEIGIDMLNPLEVKAGMDPIFLKRTYGNRLALHGGMNALLFNRPDKLWDEMRRVIPVMKENGGYVISSDHSVPDSIGLEDFRRFIELGKELGSYG